MDRLIRFDGWAVYADSGAPYRVWEVLQDIPDLRARAGDRIHDAGPRREPGRLVVRTPEGKIRYECGPGEFRAALELPLPPWKPPRTTDLEVVGLLRSLGFAVERVALALQAGGAARRRAPEATEEGDTKPPPSNGLLRLRGRFRFSNGDPYTEWELLVDAQEVGARKGDTLREVGDEVELRRDGKVVGHPEPWQVRHLFRGLPRDEDRGGKQAEDSDPSPGERLLLPGAGSVYRATTGIPGTRVQAGDLVGRDLPRVAARGAQLLRVPRREFLPLVRGFDALAEVRPTPEWCRPLRAYLAHPSARRGADTTSTVWILRAPGPSRVTPVQAASDEAAIFELLAEVGCRPG